MIQIINVNLSVLKEQAILEINEEFAKEPTISPFDLDSEFHQWESVIKNKAIKEAIDGYKKQILVAIKEVRELKMSQRHQDNYNGWTREQLIFEITRLKAENKELRNNRILTDSLQQTRLQQNQQKLEKIQNVLSFKDNQKPTNNNFPTGLMVGGTLLVIISLISILIIKKQEK